MCDIIYLPQLGLDYFNVVLRKQVGLHLDQDQSNNATNTTTQCRICWPFYSSNLLNTCRQLLLNLFIFFFPHLFLVFHLFPLALYIPVFHFQKGVQFW